MPLPLAVLLSLALVLSPPAFAQGVGQGKKKAKPEKVTTEQVASTVITAEETSIIKGYLRRAASSAQGLPPGLAKREQLPPGLAKLIQRNGTLPPGLAKRELPPDLKAVLPERPPGQEFVAVGDDMLLLDTATNVILDVMKNVLRGK